MLSEALCSAADKDERKKHIPMVDRTPLQPPPIIVAIVGPSKHYVRHTLTEIRGPITIVTGKTRRVTFVEAKVKHTKKLLKHRFWTEVYQGAKLFYLSGLINEQYLRNEIRNLARFISVTKFRPLIWRTTHPYITAIPDPCPLPSNEKAKRSLNERKRVIYAPFSGLGGIVYDKDAIYIETGGSHSYKRARRHELVEALETVKEGIDEKMHKRALRMVASSKVSIVDNGESTSEYSSSADESGEDEGNSSEEEAELGTFEQKEITLVQEEKQRPANDWSELCARVGSLYNDSSSSEKSRLNWAKLVYSSSATARFSATLKDEAEEPQEKDEMLGGLFKVAARSRKTVDCMVNHGSNKIWIILSLIASIRIHFREGGGWGKGYSKVHLWL
ncbi:unnamed protein product [Gongylonema pulchrum]|uniref:AARP2CN domain-containing protein n=1 Tax=Gongylonema pulchrum TaxID=637853 RepID=A0A183E0U9_9BILA|nr:unnamed protein product [Gongylonema pulchrum]